MSTKQRSFGSIIVARLLLVMPLLLGFAGGAIATRVLMPPAVQAQDVPQLLSARQFTLVDASGRVRAELASGGVGDNAQVSLTMYGGLSGRDAARIFVDGSGRGTILLSQNGGATPAVSMGTMPGGGPRINVADSQGNVRFSLTGDGNPFMNACQPGDGGACTSWP